MPDDPTNDPDGFHSTELTPTEAGSSPADPARQIGPYRLLERLGEGGMGEVWLAEQSRPVRRRVALKLIKRGMDSDEISRRFLIERQILARLQHPNIARLLDGGVNDPGQPFFALEYVDGGPLLENCTAKRGCLGIQPTSCSRGGLRRNGK